MWFIVSDEQNMATGAIMMVGEWLPSSSSLQAIERFCVLRKGRDGFRLFTSITVRIGSAVWHISGTSSS